MNDNNDKTKDFAEIDLDRGGQTDEALSEDE